MKNNRPYTNRLCILAVGAAILISIASLALAVYTLARFDAYDKESMKQQTMTGVKIEQLQFCVDKSIAPCDDVSLKQWNSTHPEQEHFNSSALQQ